MVCVGEQGLCLCSKTLALIIHNDFKANEEYARPGNQVDVAMLRALLPSICNCKVAEIANKGSQHILRTLSQKEMMLQLFYPAGDYDLNNCEPEVFILFVLSHGDSGGLIWTDQTITFEEETGEVSSNFDSYTTDDVFKALKKSTLLKNCLKLLFFGTCRGDISEVKVSRDQLPTKNSVAPTWLTSKPNQENFVILYATAPNTRSQRHRDSGTWMVYDICEALKKLEERESLLEFLIRVQNSLCYRSKQVFNKLGQTPQMHVFGHKEFHFCVGSKKEDLISLHIEALSQDSTPEQTNLTGTDSVGSQINLCEGQDAANYTVKRRIATVDANLNYKWPPDKFRGKAFVFTDTSHQDLAKSFSKALVLLGYKTSIYPVDDIVSVTESAREGFKRDAGLVLCVLADLQENSQAGLVTEVNGSNFPLFLIADKFNAYNCPYLVGKTKIFFFLNQGTRADMTIIRTVQSHLIELLMRNYFNVSADVVTVVGVGIETKDSFLHKCIQALHSLAQDPNLNFQTTFADVISSSSEFGNSAIKPQMISTLQARLSFPKMKSNICGRMARRWAEIEKSNFFAIIGAICFVVIVIFQSLINI